MSTIDLTKHKAHLATIDIRSDRLFFVMAARSLAVCLVVSFLLQPVSHLYANEALATEDQAKADAGPEQLDNNEGPQDIDQNDVETDSDPERNADEDKVSSTNDISTKDEGGPEVEDEKATTTDEKEETDGDSKRASATPQVIQDDASAKATSTNGTTTEKHKTNIADDASDIQSTTSPTGTSTTTNPTVTTDGVTEDGSATTTELTNDEEAESTSTPATSSDAVSNDTGEGENDDTVVRESPERGIADSQDQKDSPSTTSATSTIQGASTTTSEMTQYVRATATVRNAQNRHQFAENECVMVGDGSYYCSDRDTETEFLADGVFSALDDGGDREIFVRRDGEEIQVTDNTYEDGAPYYDESGDRIVWHSLRGDRYQIISYDLRSGDTRVLTDTDHNSMEPVAYGDITLWQAWIGDNWEVILDEDGEQIQLTDNDHHDVAPHIRDDHIIWRSQIGDNWHVRIYDRESGTIETIEGDGGSIENPRFVLVYDSIKANGDTQTLGYDLKNKEVIPLSSGPRPVPEDLPEPDTTGEERALINNKTSSPRSSTGEGEDDDGASQGVTTDDNETDLSTGSTTIEDVIVTKEADEAASTTATSTPVEDPHSSATEAELVVPQYDGRDHGDE